MKLTLILCAKTNEKWISKGEDLFTNRIRKYINFEKIVLPDIKAKLPVKNIKEKEGEQILSKINNSDLVILLDEKGDSFTSKEFANDLQKTLNSGRKRVVYVIGGPYGFSEKVYQRADKQISLSKMTFSHQIIRVIFLEQLYRAFTILNNEPYHHE
ncbi:MAG: 23S rRNA (pseudouridine(1915)-N(3))-methyltransferase RlmH [Bacteroidales bacterium]|jgi:23S rRNA (pseudouridine1915-N3)-methyltransferase